jgi:hypothetical protein
MSGDVPEWLWVIHPAARDADYRIEVVVGMDEFDPEDFNADVQVIRDKDVRWSGTFYTLANLHSLLEQWAATGEYGGGLFFMDTYAVIVRRFDRETIEATVAAFVAEGEIE